MQGPWPWVRSVQRGFYCKCLSTVEQSLMYTLENTFPQGHYELIALKLTYQILAGLEHSNGVNSSCFSLENEVYQVFARKLMQSLSDGS